MQTGLPESENSCQWFVLRDLKRANAKLPAYKQLAEAGFDVFTPLTTRISVNGGKRMKEDVPVIRDLLFVHATRSDLDPVVARTDTLQYRFVRGGKYCDPMTVPAVDMHRFITAVGSSEKVRYYQPAEITPDMLGAEIRLVCDGPLDGYTGRLLKVRGSTRRQRLGQRPGLRVGGGGGAPTFIRRL
ncbi:MAG: UpxY family transcription antiterminator [Muribaculaceae bacterium]|nr:UpxY family transcription antiterminator [Muribaculaceae bacterium]